MRNQAVKKGCKWKVKISDEMCVGKLFCILVGGMCESVGRECLWEGSIG